MQIVLFVFGIVMFIGLVLVHELGHLWAARRSGVDVQEFGLGFPPRAAARKTKSGMILSLNWLPLGGFVKLKGEHDSDRRKGSFGAAPLSAKVKIMLAGVAMNAVVGLALLTLLALIGLPQLISRDQFGQDQFSIKSDQRISKQEVLTIYVEPGSPAAKVGLSNLDNIVSVSDASRTKVIKSADDLKLATNQFAGQTVKVVYRRDGQVQSKTIKLRSKSEVASSLGTDHQKGYLGVQPYNLVFTRATWSAPIVAVGFAKQLTVLTFQGLGHALAGLGSLLAGATTGNRQARVNGQDEATSQVGGPVAIVKILWGTGSIGYQYMLTIIAIISLTLAMMNILPIPALDGGRLLVTLASRAVLRRPLQRKTEELIHGTGMALLLCLIVLITIVDVNRFF